jgi:D-serine deaminase-like pyridoxal phosphate-dependent protein
MAAHVKVTTLQSYSGNQLPKPDKILIYDLVADPSDVQVDASQKIRPRHIISGDEKPEAILQKTQTTFSEELKKKLAKSGLPVEHVAADTAPSANSLVVQGKFLVLHQGTKTERVAVGMGTGSAGIQTKVDVRLKTAPDLVLLSEFQTETTKAKSIGGAVPVAAGMNPAAVGAKSVVTDRKKTLNAYAVQTAEASAGEILKAMAGQGWVKLNDKGQVIP